MGFLNIAREIVSPSTPPLCCDLCQWPMGAHEIVRNEDGSIPGLLVCSLCVEDNLATADQPRCEVGLVGTSL
jgi:hypothetical protein